MFETEEIKKSYLYKINVCMYNQGLIALIGLLGLLEGIPCPALAWRQITWFESWLEPSRWHKRALQKPRDVPDIFKLIQF